MTNRGRAVLAAALPFVVFGALAAVSWNRWIEPYVDSGRELMIPWRLARGERLYRDLHFHHGPLGPWLAAVVDAAAGPSLPARLVLCAAIAIGHLAALSALSRRFLPPLRAALAVSVAIATAVFLRPGGWLFPFSLDVALAVTALTVALALDAPEGSMRADAAAGACVLAALLSRPELGFAGALVLALAARQRPRRVVALGLAPILAAAVGYALLSLGTPLRTLVEDGWLRLIRPSAAFGNVYRAYAGLDRPFLRGAELALALIALALVAAYLLAFSWAASRREAAGRRGTARALEGVAVAGLAGAAILRARPPAALADSLALWPPLVRVIPPAIVLAAALRLLRSFRTDARRGILAAVPDAVLWMAALFAIRLLLAAGYVGPYDAFFLPLPLVVAIAGVFGAADRVTPVLGPALPRLAVAAIGIFGLFRSAALLDLYRGRPWSPVETPAGSLTLPEPIASATSAALGALRTLPATATLAGFPEVGFFNYVLGLRNPFWLEQFFPGHLDDRGEARAIGTLTTHPASVLLRANVVAVGEGSPAFGRDYLQKLDRAARERYRTAAMFGPGAREGARIGDVGFFLELAVPRQPAVEGVP
jgi:hypothetical protein